MNKFLELIKNIKSKFLNKKTIVPNNEILELMLKYKSNIDDWSSLVVKNKKM